jgi:peptidoglycan/LPS O-acetylase OafA/YrhL
LDRVGLKSNLVEAKRHMENGQTKKQRLEEVDILRGFSAVGIIFFHVWALQEFQGKSAFLDQVLIYFGVGVPLFFVISSFSLLYGYHDRIFDEQSIKKFYIRRFFRLAPLFYCLLPIYLLIAWIDWKAIMGIGTILSNLTFTYQLIPTKHESIVWGGWSLGIEWVFYWLFPLIVIVSRSVWFTIIIFLATLTISVKFDYMTSQLVSADPTLNYMNTMKHLVFFMLGVLLFQIRTKVQAVGNSFPWLFRLDFIILPFAVILFVELQKVIPKEIALSLSFAIIMIWAFVGYGKLFNNPFTRLLGKTSYGLYLLNPITIYFVNKSGFVKLVNEHTSNPITSFLICGAFSFVIIVIFSVLVYKFIEQPGIRLGQKLAKGKS